MAAVELAENGKRDEAVKAFEVLGAEGSPGLQNHGSFACRYRIGFERR